MVRSCTPPPLSDRKRVLADAHRRQSLALPRPSFSHAVESENDEESDAADYMDVDESPSTERIWGRNAKRGGDSALRSGIDEVPEAGPSSRTYLKSSGSRPKTPERPHARTNLPTWTPLRVPHGSESSQESDSLTATSRRDKQRVSRASIPSTYRDSHGSPKTAPAPRPKSNTPYNPSKEFRFPKDVIRWLPASVLGGRETTPLQTKPVASPHKSVSNGQNHSGPPQRQSAGPSATSSGFKPTSQAHVAVLKAPKAIEDRAPRPQVKTHSNSGDGWVKDLAAALNRSFVNPDAKGKGKARLPPQNALSDSEESVEADPAQGDLLSSPAIPHPPLPEDSFEDSIWVDEDDDPPRVLSSSTRRTLRRLPLGGSRASAWLRRLDNEDVFESRKAYYVGQKPRRLRIKKPPVKRASSLGTVLAKRKRTINSTSPSYTTNARAQAAAFNAAIAANLRDHSLTPLDSQPATRSNVRDPAQVFAAASANNVNVDRPATTARLPQSSKIGQPSMKRRHTLTHRSAPASPFAFKRRRTMAVSGREASEEIVEGLLDKVPADTTDREENTGEWYLDLDTLIWRRRASGEPTATSATPRFGAG
ncbi:hypothetical protein PHLGIDRAFT_169234 [Phlebiopsis gigantea 11061_1 CR5-6]|uniref:Uncharacterized protein n=1 Tax=Phlebiopsis gigantea (strain 11061_1 CR5-6) TaxID=745531 RepID=A0A0C3PGY3_PHLG1|nr:hypothetical protein PHLGIDRAFT_169234 [Phlebiopsis gigantea 11061_1 CR5-6]